MKYSLNYLLIGALGICIITLVILRFFGRSNVSEAVDPFEAFKASYANEGFEDAANEECVSKCIDKSDDERIPCFSACGINP